jgi:hypothetical protein
MNDLQFLTGPSGADIDGLPGVELVAGSASKDLQAFNAAGVPASAAWPKVTTDWTVTMPLVGSFGEKLDVDAGATKVVIGLTRSGYLNAYSTDAPACSAGSWPRFHHDNANSGNYDRDATLPGRPFEAVIDDDVLSFRAPGDDLLCGTADHYEVVTSQSPIDEAGFASADPLSAPPEPQAAGEEESYELPDDARRFIAVRAVDEQGNVGRPAIVDQGGGFGSGNPGGGGAGGGPGDGGGSGSGGDGSGSGGDVGDGSGPATGPCANEIPGTARDDKLTGTDGADRIEGGGGADPIAAAGGDDSGSGQGGTHPLGGARGDDELRGGRGTDRVAGGAGDDVIHVRRGSRDRVDCGPGEDTVVLNANRDRARNCEHVRE